MIKDKMYYLSLKFYLSKRQNIYKLYALNSRVLHMNKKLIELKIKAKSCLIKIENLNVSLFSITDQQNQ